MPAIIVDLFFLIGGGFFVWLGAEGIVSGSVKLANYFGVSAMVVGLTIVAFGTSAPELVVSSIASIKGHNEIALGNVLGSNIINIFLVLGVSAVIASIKVKKETLKHDLPLVAGITVLVVVLVFWRKGLDRIDGLILLLLFAGYTVYSFLRAFKENRRVTQVEQWVRPELKTKHIVYLIAGIPALTIGAHIMVEGAVGVATAAGISEQIVAMTMVAFGTSLPELAASAVAARHGEGDLAIGNVLGSNLYNMTLILGTASFISPIETSASILSASFIFFLLAIFILFPIMRIKWNVSRNDGILLLGLYVLSVVFLFV